MIVDVKFFYDAEFIRKGHRKAEKLWLTAVEPILVREVSDDEAPVTLTMSWRTATGNYWGDDPRDPDRINPDRLEVRCFDGGFWKPLVIQDYAIKKHHIASPEELARQMAYSSDWRLNRDPGFGDIQVRHLLWSGEEEGRLQAAKAGDRYILVDGVPYVRTTEPVYKVSESSAFSGPHRVYLDASSLGEAGELAQNIFRADRLDAALSRAAVLNRGPLDDDFLDGKEDRLFELVRPELLRYDDEGAAILRSADWLLGGYDHEDTLKKGDLDFFAAYCALRDAISAKETHILADCMQNLMGAGSGLDLRNYRTDDAEEAIRRWNALQASLRNDPELATIKP